MTKGKTLGPQLDGHGFVPGYSKGGRWLSEDRTERPVAALITLTIWRRWRHSLGSNNGQQEGLDSSAQLFPAWVLQLLYPDLLDYINWLWEKRRLPPLNLGCAGSDPCFTPPLLKNDSHGGSGSGGGSSSNSSSTTPPASWWCKKSWGMGKLQGARFESLDNSPMYDSPPGGNYTFWNSSIHRMELYDVGQSAAIVSECNALAELAELLNHDDDAAVLRQRAKTLGSLINKHMWAPELSVYSNVLTTGKLYPRISPTSFLPLLAGLATDTQAVSTTTRWLTNRSRFCVPVDAEAWPPAGGPPSSAIANHSCYWGLPSISADDDAFMVAGGTSGIYWRGQTWAPQAFLTYLALKKYAHVPALAAAAKGLCTQQLDLMLSVWRPQHHICENYGSIWDPSPRTLSPDPSGNECTGNRFYSWGGLSALMSLMENGHY